MQAWIEEMAPFVKSLDPAHLLTIGSDGFMQRSNCQSELANPQPSRGRDGNGPEGVGWPLATGQDHVANHAVSAIDYQAFHLWPDNWERPDLGFGRVWLREKIRNAAMLNKPLVLEEAGKAASGPFPASTPQAQLDWYRLIYDTVSSSIDKGTGLAGVMFWRWGGVDTGGDLGEFDRGSLITTESAVFRDVVSPFSARVAARDARTVVKGCRKEAAAGGVKATAKATAPAATNKSTPAATNTSIPAATTTTGGVSAASTGVGATRRLAGWADVSDVDVGQLAVQLPGGYRPAGLSGPWAGATSSQLKMAWNPEFVPAPTKPAAKKVATPPKPTAAAAPAASAPAANKTAPATNKTAPAANKTAPAATPKPAAPAAAVAVDPIDAARSAEPRLGGGTKIDADAMNRRITCAA